MKRTLLAGLLAAGTLLLAAAPGHAALDVTAFDGFVGNADGTPVSQAASHPYEATTSITFATVTDPNGMVRPVESVRDVTVALPAGFVGNPQATRHCAQDFLTNPINGGQCPPDTQVGIVDVDGSLQDFHVPLWTMETPKGVPALLAFTINGQPVYGYPEVRPNDFGLTFRFKNISQAFGVLATKVTLWGVPYDASHDAERGVAITAPRRSFVTNPTACTGPLTTTLEAVSWQDAASVARAAFVSHDDNAPANPLGVTGCDAVPFEPSASVTPSTTAPDAPAGVTFALALPQDDSPDGLATAHLKRVAVTLPEGMTINPASADGLQTCSDEQLGLGTKQPLACPEAAKIGTVTAHTPLLTETLTGGIYLRPQQSDDPASGDMFRLAIVLRNDDRAIDLRLAGQIKVDPATGRVQTIFDNNPQLPVSDLQFRLKDGARAPLATPPSCGEKTSDIVLTAWSGKEVTRRSSFNVDCAAGLGGFGPSVSAGTEASGAAQSSPFDLRIRKADGESALTGLSLSLPPGLLAHLKGNLGTQVGSVKAFAGPGSNPYVLPGQVFLEGRYDDAPFSLRVVVPAKAGPFDLGTVIVRQKVYVDPIDAHVTIVSDPLPTIVKGVPVRLQRLEVDVDKPGFMVNPTSCAAKAITGTLSAASGQTAAINNRFQVSGCASLALKPSVALSLSGKGQTTDGKHPAISAVVSQPAGQANLKKVRVVLPLSLALDPDNSDSDALCSFAEGSKPDPKCPASSVVGKATAVSPILNEPLTGPVFFVKNERKDPKSGRSIKTTPKLVIPLTGENGVKLTLTGASTVVDDQLVTTFDNIPDAQVSSFKMNINGGNKGILVVSSADICAATQIADQRIDGQNNKSADADVYIQTPSCALKVLSKKVGKRSVVVKVGGLGAGKVTVTGRGLKKTTKTITRSTVATITAKRTKGKAGKVTVSYDPAGPAKARKTTK